VKIVKDELSALRIGKDKRVSGHSAGVKAWVAVSVLLFAALVTVSVYAFWWLPRSADGRPAAAAAAATEESAPPPPVAEPLSREVLIASGYVVAHHKHELGSKVMGRVQWIGVEKGDFVEKGQLLVKLEDREYRAQLEQAQASLALAQQRLAELEAGSRPEEIDRAEAELERARAELANATLEHQRLSSLLKQGVISDQEVANAMARMKMAQGAAGSADKTLELLKLGPRDEQVQQARAEVGRAEGAVEYAQTMLDATEIRAPISGTVLRRIAEVGEMITTSFAGTSGAKSAVVALADLNDLQVELDISQTDFNRISSDLDCIMTPEAYLNRKYRCRIDEISPEADRQKASIQVKVRVVEPDDYLRPEMSARVTFLRGDDHHD
jgi:HlyD family secretion protein